MSAVRRNRHPADELAQVRLEIKALEGREKTLRDLLIGDREARVGVEKIALVSERSRSTVDWKALAKKLGATDDDVASFTKDSIYSQVDTLPLPDLSEMLHLLTGDVLVVDCETTGFSPAAGDRIVSVGLLAGRVHAVDGDHAFVTYPPGARQWYVNPGRASNPGALAVHGLTEAFLADKPAFADVDEEIGIALHDAVLVAHNAPFDLSFLDSEFARGRFGEPSEHARAVVDTRVIAKLLWPDQPGTLDALAERLGVARTEREAGVHDALGDCMLLARCLPGLVEAIRGRLA